MAGTAGLTAAAVTATGVAPASAAPGQPVDPITVPDPTDPVLGSRANGDVDDEFQLLANGTMRWGDGTGDGNYNFLREASNGLETDHYFTIRMDVNPKVAPELHFRAANGAWLTGMDVANKVPGRDMTVASKILSPNVVDFIYVAHNGSGMPSCGIGFVPPGGDYVLSISPGDGQNFAGSANPQGGLVIRISPNQQTATHAFAILQSSGTESLWVDADSYLSGRHPLYGSAVAVKADAVNQRPLAFVNPAASTGYAFQFNGDSLRFRYINGGTNIFQMDGDGTTYFYKTFRVLGPMAHQGRRVGFYGNAAVTRPVVSGSKLGNKALAAIITALARVGLIVDSTT